MLVFSSTLSASHGHGHCRARWWHRGQRSEQLDTRRAALAAALFVGLLQWPGRRLFVQHLLDDWIFARRYIHGEHAVLGPRLDRVAKRLCEAARASEADEVLVLGPAS